jgi:hypothetical protein
VNLSAEVTGVSRKEETVGVWIWSRLAEIAGDERGDVPGWVLIVLMTSGLVVAIWSVARDKLIAIVSAALSTVCGSVGC